MRKRLLLLSLLLLVAPAGLAAADAEPTREQVQSFAEGGISETDRQFWSFQEILRPPLPDVEDGPMGC